jgi:hypothetical protein
VPIALDHGRLLDLPVHDNFYAARVQSRAGRHVRPAPLAASWVDEHGDVIKTVRPPAPPARRREK